MGGGMPGGGGGGDMMAMLGPLMKAGGSVKAEVKPPKPITPSPQQQAYQTAQGPAGLPPGTAAPQSGPTPMNPAAIMSGLQQAGMARPGPMYGGAAGLTPSGLPGAAPNLGQQQNLLRALAGQMM